MLRLYHGLGYTLIYTRSYWYLPLRPAYREGTTRLRLVGGVSMVYVCGCELHVLGVPHSPCYHIEVRGGL